MMTSRKCKESSSRMSKYVMSKDVLIHICGCPFSLDRELLASRSAKLSEILKKAAQEDITCLLPSIPADPESFELVARFCHGYEVNITTENVIKVCCLAKYLRMTEEHCPDNLLKKALTFFEFKVIPNWDDSVRALKSTENPTILQHAGQLNLINACVDSIITKALNNPPLLGEPIKNLVTDDDDDDDDDDKENGNECRPKARRRLFLSDWKLEDLTTLSLHLYEPIIRGMIQCQVPLEYLAANLYGYAKRWVFSEGEVDNNDISFQKKCSKREAIETIERLLPNEKGILPCSLLFEMLRFAIELEASAECRSGLELRVGKQLDQATVKDLLIPSQGYAKEERYDNECVRRILKNFYCNYTDEDGSGYGLLYIADLIEDFLAEVASDIDLEKGSFIELAEMAIDASVGTQRTSDGIYKAIDVFLDKHRYLTESEREAICGVLDCNKMSPEACEHAAQNERLPLRVVVQVLFVGQLQLRETVAKEVQSSDDGLRKLEDGNGENGKEVKMEMEKMSSKVIELERQCCKMRKEIQSGCSCKVKKKEKVSVWKEMKRKFGCVSSMHDCNCHVKKIKVHPR